MGTIATRNEANRTRAWVHHAPTDETREQVYNAVTQGKSQAAIARELSISVPTLKRHYADDIALARGLVPTNGAGASAEITNKFEWLPDDTDREYVQRAALIGAPHSKIAQAMGVSLKTLKAKYAEELALGRFELTNEAAGHLVRKMRLGDTQAIIFFLKTRAGWQERTGLDLSNEDGSLAPRTINIVAAKIGGAHAS